MPYSWNGAAVAEGIHMISGLGRHAELFPDAALSEQRVPGQAFAAGDVAVG